MQVNVVVFPGSNCDHDVLHVYKELVGAKVKSVWHKETVLPKADVVVIPGGFSYGDYLRTGALAKLSPIMQEVAKFAANGGKVIGICNGFQILCESGLLEGVLLNNTRTKFLSRFVTLKVENNTTAFTSNFAKGDLLTCPIAHGEGNFFADPEVLKSIESEGRVVFRYSDSNGLVQADNIETNPNGSQNAIAGICNKQGNVVGLMPHPERSSEVSVGAMGGASGLKVFG